MNSTTLSPSAEPSLGMKRFENQVAIVTGGNSGLGLAIVHRLAHEGATVIVLALEGSPLDEPEIDAAERVSYQRVDVTDPQQVHDAVAKVLSQHGRIDVLVNSAGITGKTNLKTHEVELADLERVMRINLFGSFLMAREILPTMVEQGYGRVLNIASIAGKDGNAGMLAYSTSKAAVIGMTKVQGKDYAETGVLVNALAPAVVRTPLVEAMPEAQVRYMTEKIPMKRCGTLEECAAMAAFIVSPEASFSTGFTFDLSGGRAVY